MSFLGDICVCNRLASGISADRLNFATRTYVKREFDSKMSRQNSPKIERKKYDFVIWYLTISL